MRKIEKSYSFLISALLSLFSLVLAVAIALSLFAKADSMSYSAQSKTVATTIAQNFLQEQRAKLENMSMPELQEYLKTSANVEVFQKHNWDNKERTFKVVSKLSESEKTQRTVLVNIDISVYSTTKGDVEEEIVSIKTNKFLDMSDR